MDWTGNKSSLRALNSIGKDYTTKGREENDFYATEPKALEKLLELETVSDHVWEPACGQGHLSKILVDKGIDVKSTDLIDRGYGTGGVDFLKQTDKFDGDIITNPPYKYALEFAEHGLNILENGRKMFLFLKITFLEGKKREKLFKTTPPKIIYVSTGKLRCGRNGVFTKDAMACYAWFIWEKGYNGETILRWFN